MTDRITSIDQLREVFTANARDLGLRTQVLMDGDFDAEICLIGEGPGNQEVNEGIPWVGAAGTLLFNALRRHGILRPNVYSTNVCKRQISLGANTRFPVGKDEWLKWKNLIQWEIDQLPNLKYILCMGNAGLSALFGEDGIHKFRGSVYDYKGKQCVLTLNPAAVIRELKDEIVFVMDVNRFADVIIGDYEAHTITKHINPSFKDAIEWIDLMKRSEADVAFDIETISNHTACYGLGNSADEAMCINLRNQTENRYTVDEEIKLLHALQSLFDTRPVIAQNGNFDAHWCGYKDYLDIRIGFDTMLAHHTLYPLLPHNLGFLTSQYTTHPFYKDDGKNWKEGGDIDDFWRYNATDVAITWAVKQREEEELRAQGLYDFFIDHVMRLDPHLVRTTVDGLLTDATVKQKVAAELKLDLQRIEAEFQNLIQRRFDNPKYVPNFQSQPQMFDLFFNRLRLNSTSKSIDKDERDKIIADVRTPQDAKDILIKFGELKRESKFYSTYAEVPVDPDNRFRTTFKQQGVASAPGRLSSAGNLWGTGSNAQNQPTRSHKFFISDPGTVMFYLDGSQAEARVVAYLADIPKWKEDFERARLTGNYDAHKALAADMYKLPYDEVPSEDWIKDEDGFDVPTIRYKAKRARHGLNYRMQYERLAEAAKLSLYESKLIYILYHKTNPEIKLWWAELERIVKKTKELWTPLGRRLRLQQRLDEEALKSIVAFVPQSTIGDHLKRVWYKAHEDDRWNMQKMRIKLNIHDAVIGIAKPSAVKTAVQICKEYMEMPIMISDVYGKKAEQLIIPADAKISEPDEKGIHRWSTLKKVKL